MKVHIVTGDRHEVERHYRELRESFFGSDPECVVDAVDRDRVHAELMSGSFFVSKKLVHLDSALFDSDWTDALARWAPHVAPRSDRLLVVRDVGASLDRRRLSRFKKSDDVVLVHFDELKSPKDAARFAYAHLKKRGAGADPGAVELLVRIVGNNRGLIASEIDKLMSVANRLTTNYVAACAFPSGGEAAHMILYSALADGDEITARSQTCDLLAEGIAPLALLASIVKILSATLAGAAPYHAERNVWNEAWMGPEKAKKVTTFMANIYRRLFERMGEKRILNTIEKSVDSLAALRLSADRDVEKTRVDRIVGEICRE